MAAETTEPSAPVPCATLYVCVTCRRRSGETDGVVEAARPDEPRAGARMLEALRAIALPNGVRLQSVECLSACSRACSVALAAPGKWSYVYGDMDPDRDAGEIARGAGLYAATADGVTPWRARPEIFRKQSLARLPPRAGLSEENSHE